MKREPWRFASASAIGTSHIASGLPCQDRSLCELIDVGGESYLTAIVCDGAGSAAHSDVGAEMAARTLFELVQVYLSDGGKLQELTRERASDWVVEVAEALAARADLNGHAVRDYACTLLVGVFGSETAAFIQVGDGAIVVSHGEADGWSYVFWPQHGEYANSTNFVISANAAEVMEFEVAPRRIDEFAMFSDGIENLVLHLASKTVHGPFFDTMIAPVRAVAEVGPDARLSRGLETYLSSPKICERTDDDKTLILASRVMGQG